VAERASTIHCLLCAALCGVRPTVRGTFEARCFHIDANEFCMAKASFAAIQHCVLPVGTLFHMAEFHPQGVDL
jgi:hypothetical protein